MKVLAFDLGKVIFDFDYTVALERITQKGASIQEILCELYENNFGLDFEKGLISGKQFYHNFKNRFNVDIDYAEFKYIWSDIFSPNNEVITLIKQLKNIWPIYLISNINEFHFEFLHRNYPQIFALFNQLILSFKVKSVKPEKAIYEELKRISGKNFEHIVYIDDREDLIAEAKLLHMHCIQFKGVEELIQQLNRLGITIPTENKN
jgi:putative hydrolase of the HAD superfamily